MFNRVPTALVSALAAAALTAGVAVAQHGDSGHEAPVGYTPEPSSKPSNEWGQFKQLHQSRLSQSAYLTGLAEIDADGDDAGDPDGKGSATFLQVDQRTVCYGFAVRGIGTPTIVHIHKGVAGENGAPVVVFSNVPKDADGQPSGNPGASAGCKTVTDPGELAALRRIRKNPSGYYLNIHTDEFSNGAIRGQLAPVWYDNKG